MHKTTKVKIRDGLLFDQSHVYILENNSICKKLLQEYHSTLLGDT